MFHIFFVITFYQISFISFTDYFNFNFLTVENIMYRNSTFVYMYQQTIVTED